MKLDSFLTSAKPCPVHPVSFKALARNPSDGSRQIADVKAVMVLVDDEERSSGVKDSILYLRDKFSVKNGKGEVTEYLEVPRDEILHEETLQTLAVALRDADDPSERFCSAAQLRKAVTTKTLAYLLEEYNRFLTNEFPSRPTAEQMRKLTQEAEGK